MYTYIYITHYLLYCYSINDVMYMYNTDSVETRCCADVLLVLDNSGSMSGHWNDAIDFARDFVNSLPISSTSTRVGVIMFNSNAAVEVIRCLLIPIYVT